MHRHKYRCTLISDFNMSNFSGYLSTDAEHPCVSTEIIPFHEMMVIIFEGKKEYFHGDNDVALIWTQPESISESFKRVLEHRHIPIEKILKEVDDYSGLLLRMHDKVSCIFVPSWVIPSYNRGLGMLDMKYDIGISNILMRMNLRLSENLTHASKVFILNTQKWIEFAGKDAFNPKLWYLAKIPFNNTVFKEAVKDIKSALRGLYGLSKKLIILDLDDTLWGGIVGDVGWENINLGGHDPVGEAYVDFQSTLKSLQNRGIILAIVSKNEESIVLEAIKNHPEMVLRLDDFTGWRINWQDKAQNIVDLISELNLGLDSVVFIDDNPHERERVRKALPEVFVPEWPQDKSQYKSTLLSLRCFDVPSISKEDYKRTNMYISERKRKESMALVESVDDWLKTLRIRVHIEELNEADLMRAAQLLNKTNQMNLSTRRMTESDLLGWAQQNGHKLWTIRVSDRFGESGLTGIISMEFSNGKGRIVDFILSCRVFGRRVENVMIHKAICFAQSAGLGEVFAKYIPTKKNKPCLEFWRSSSGFLYDQNDDVFFWKTSSEYPIPNFINLEQKHEIG